MLVTPVSEVSTGRSIADALIVHKQDEAVIGADANLVAFGHGRQVQRATEVQNNGLAERGGWMRDPGGLPFTIDRIGLG